MVASLLKQQYKNEYSITNQTYDIYSFITMSQVQILLSSDTSYQEKLDAATNIINNYDLQLLQEEIMSVFTKARRDINAMLASEDLRLYILKQHQFLFDTLLNTNKNLFVAMTKAHDKEYLFYQSDFTVLVYGDEVNHKIGYFYASQQAVSIYCKLLDYNDFDVDNLVLTKNIKFEIQQYKQKKYGGKFTKAVL